MEPQMRKLRYLLRDHLHIRYYMGGLIRNWDSFSDHMNDISRPSQMGPLWMEAKHITGQPLHESMWINNPVTTTYTSCMAVKAAGMQSFVAEEAMLRQLREAVMLHKKNLAEENVIMQTARDLAQEKILDLKLFTEKWLSPESSDLFRKDLEQIRIKKITRFPTLLINNGVRTIQITGYRPFQVLLDAFKNLDSELRVDEKIDPEEYKKNWANLTERELQEVESTSKEEPTGVY